MVMSNVVLLNLAIAIVADAYKAVMLKHNNERQVSVTSGFYVTMAVDSEFTESGYAMHSAGIAYAATIRAVLRWRILLRDIWC